MLAAGLRPKRNLQARPVGLVADHAVVPAALSSRLRAAPPQRLENWKRFRAPF
jgi:hypothetical protein